MKYACCDLKICVRKIVYVYCSCMYTCMYTYIVLCSSSGAYPNREAKIFKKT